MGGVRVICCPVATQSPYRRKERAVMEAWTVLDHVREVSARFAAERRERQQRQGLVATDFAQLCEAGFPLAGVPVDHGGIWESVRRSTRPLCELLRTLAHGDSSVALVCAMHPTVLVFW